MDDSDFVEKSLKSTRELKCKLEEIISKPMIESDYLLPGGDKDKCFVCNKDLKHLDELRKSLHINNCLDQQEACTKYEAKKEEWKKVVDCPICGEPLEPGPFRAAHAKRCGKKHHVNPNSLLLLLDTQTKVAEAKKRSGTAHTKLKEPKLVIKKRPNRFSEEPRSLFDEQMKLTTALSASMCSSESEIYTETQEVPQKLPKIKSRKQRPRSFSFIELEPRACKCEVIERVQENFLNIFKTRDGTQDMRTMLKKNIQNTEDILKNIGVDVRKLNSLKQLADDLADFNDSNSDVIVFSRENETFLACRFIIAARAPTLLQHLNPDGSLTLREYSGAAVRSYISFLTSASIIWTENEREEVYSMAIKYGPKGLAAMCKSAKLETNLYEESVEQHPEINENCDDMVEVSNKEEIEQIEEGQHYLDAKLKVYDNEKEETKNIDSDDPSIVFVEEVGRNTEIAEAAKNMRSLLKEASENLSGPSESEFLSNEGNEFISGSPDFLHYSLPNCNKASMNEKFEFLEKGVDKTAKLNNSFLLGDNVDSNAPVSSSPLLPRTASNVDVMDHLNDSTEILLKKLSPIKSIPSCYEVLSPVACYSGQAVTNSLLDNSSLEKPFISPNSIFESERTRLSTKLLVRTKSSPEFSFTPKKSSSPLLSALSLLDPSSTKNVSLSPERKRVRAAVFERQTSTPEVPTSRLVQRFEELNSNVKILKTKNITPMPVYDLMNDKELKAELAKFGIRPMGKKRGVALLKRIYEETHPVLESTPLSRKSRKYRQMMAERDTEGCSDEDCDMDKTLNRSLDECDIMEESCMNEEQSAVLPKDLEGMQSVLLSWLRREENSSLYNHLLGLNVISFEEFASHLSHADSTVSQIPKKALIEILDRLHVTFRMPMDGWNRKKRRAKKLNHC
uniref:BTB domain-containing protein n=1 Tax=Elaeophora elaphi TaxID=1147741 RepID=A0A0R3RQH5_9BILA